MDNERYYVKYLQLDSQLELAHAKIRDLEKKIETSPQGQAIPATERPKVLSSDEKQAIGSQETTQIGRAHV